MTGVVIDDDGGIELVAESLGLTAGRLLSWQVDQGEAGLIAHGDDSESVWVRGAEDFAHYRRLMG